MLDVSVAVLIRVCDMGVIYIHHLILFEYQGFWGFMIAWGWR